MTKHKIARKVASNKSPTTNNTIMLEDWIKEAYPEIWGQYRAIKDLEDAVEPPDLDIEHLKAHLKYLMQQEDVKMKWLKNVMVSK